MINQFHISNENFPAGSFCKIRQNTPTTVKTSVGEASEILGSLFNTHECLIKSGVEIQKRMESHPATKKMEFFQRPRSASLRDPGAKDQRKSVAGKELVG